MKVAHNNRKQCMAILYVIMSYNCVIRTKEKKKKRKKKMKHFCEITLGQWVSGIIIMVLSKSGCVIDRRDFEWFPSVRHPIFLSQ